MPISKTIQSGVNVSAAAVLALALGTPNAAAESELRISQVATIEQTSVDDSRAVVNQRGVPTNDQARAALAPDDGQIGEFDFYEGASDESLADVLGTFRENVESFGANNIATVRQRQGEFQSASGNRALAVQAGSGNRLTTIQTGSKNIGVHLQRGSGNDTVLRQTGNGNVNALVAQGGVYAEDGGALELNVEGGVRGFSLRAQGGPQPYSTVTVRPNGPNGGFDIDMQ